MRESPVPNAGYAAADPGSRAGVSRIRRALGPEKLMIGAGRRVVHGARSFSPRGDGSGSHRNGVRRIDALARLADRAVTHSG